MELPFSSQDVTTVMTLLSDIKGEVRTIRLLLEEDDDEEESAEDDT